MSKLHKVFVYGTLKKGEPNHHWMQKSENAITKFICDAKTIDKYPLIIATRYNIPFVLHKPGVGFNVLGELYEVDDITLKHLDTLEDHPNYYIREQNPVLTLNDQKAAIPAWIYFIKNFKPELLEKQMFEKYTSNGEHGLQYMESNNESTIEDLNKDDLNIHI